MEGGDNGDAGQAHGAQCVPPCVRARHACQPSCENGHWVHGKNGEPRVGCDGIRPRRGQSAGIKQQQQQQQRCVGAAPAAREPCGLPALHQPCISRCSPRPGCAQSGRHPGSMGALRPPVAPFAPARTPAAGAGHRGLPRVKRQQASHWSGPGRCIQAGGLMASRMRRVGFV